MSIESKNLKIVGLQVENFKKIKAVNIIPKGNVIKISGENGQGKSSVLDAIWMALDEANAAKKTKTTEPIHNGAEKGSSTVDLDEIKVTRSWTPKGSYLKVVGKDGKKLSSPQKVLDSLIGKLTFDPTEFMQMSDSERLKTLLDKLDLPIDLEQLDYQKKQLYDERTIVNRTIKSLEAQLEGIPYIEGVPIKVESMSDLVTELETAQKSLMENKKMKDDLKNLQESCKRSNEKIENLKASLKAAEAEKAEIIAQGKILHDKVEKLIDPDIEKIRKRMAEMEQTNTYVRSNLKRAGIAAELEGNRQDAEALTEDMDLIELQKNEAFQSVKMPLNGLSFDDRGVTFNDVPFGQCSDSEKLKISMAMAMALNPQIRVIRMKNGCFLHKKNLQVVEDMARDNDFQVWIKLVDDTGEIGIYIEDGEVVEKAVNGGAA